MIEAKRHAAVEKADFIKVERRQATEKAECAKVWWRRKWEVGAICEEFKQR